MDNIYTKLNEVREYALDRIKNEENIIYHYTSPEGFNGILWDNENPIFRFSRFDVLNDISEGRDIIDVYENICKKLCNEHRIDDAFYDVIKDVQWNNKTLFVKKKMKIMYE